MIARRDKETTIRRSYCLVHCTSTSPSKGLGHGLLKPVWALGPPEKGWSLVFLVSPVSSSPPTNAPTMRYKGDSRSRGNTHVSISLSFEVLLCLLTSERPDHG